MFQTAKQVSSTIILDHQPRLTKTQDGDPHCGNMSSSALEPYHHDRLCSSAFRKLNDLGMSGS